MARRFITEIGEHEDIDEVFLVAEKQLRTNRNGNLYLQLRLSDKTGTVNAMMWNANDRSAQGFENGDYVSVKGSSQFYNGNLQFIVNHIEKAEPGSVNEDDFVQMSLENVDKLASRLAEMLREISDFHLKNLAECFIMDDAFQKQFCSAPAGIKNHHAYPGGLLEHVVSLMEVVRVVAPRYPQLNGDLLLMGAFLHDIGKLEELTFDKGLAYSDEGQLVGHLVQGVMMLERKLREAEELSGEPFPAETAMQLRHMIVSHHGKLEFGSPKVPMTLEAIALHFLDDLDAKLFSFDQIIREDVNTDSAWTSFQPILSRKIYKGSS
ncbi:MAG: HD domain-containing protein [Pirellulaceae bacterium]